MPQVKVVLINKDSSTTHTTIVKKNSSEKGNRAYFFDFITIINQDGSLKNLEPSEVLGYSIGNKYYKTLSIRTGSKTSHIFSKVEQSGAADLYHYKGELFGFKDIYIFNRDDGPFYYVTMEDRLIGQDMFPGSINSQPDLTLQRQLNELIVNCADGGTFKNQFLRFFSDCEIVTRKLKQNWYTPSSITSLFEDYNNACP